MTRRIPFYALAMLGISFTLFTAGCGKSGTATSAAPTADQAQAQQQAGEAAAAAAKAQGEAVRNAAMKQSGGPH